MKTYTKEITFISLQANPNSDPPGLFEETEVKKIATFRELSRIDPNQEKLCWKIIKLFEGQDVEDGEAVKQNISDEGLCELVNKYIRTCIVINESFTEQDKKEFLTDTGAKMNFGFWVLGEKITPFFSKLMKT